MNDIIVQFAMLWGETMVSATKSEEFEKAEELKQYDSEEVLHLLTAWAEEYLKTDDVYVEDFFDDKVNELVAGKKFPEIVKKIATNNIAIAAIEHGIARDLNILEEWDDADEYFMETYGCTLEDAEKILDHKFDIRGNWENEH